MIILHLFITIQRHYFVRCYRSVWFLCSKLQCSIRCPVGFSLVVVSLACSLHVDTPALSVGWHWWHPAHQCSRCSVTPSLSPSAGTDGIRLVSIFCACETLLLGPSAGTIFVGSLAQSVALCSVATLSHYALPCSSHLLSYCPLSSSFPLFPSLSPLSFCVSVCPPSL